MAAYAAFKHVELYNVGKTKKRVLRPPGGGTSDIFGGDLPQTPRSVKNHMQSNIFSCEKDSIKNNGDQPRRAQKNVDSYQRLFGEPERPVTPAKNHMKSNIPFGAKSEAAQALISNGNGNGHYNGKSGSVSSTSSSVSSSTENLKINGFSKTDQSSPQISARSIDERKECNAQDKLNADIKENTDSASLKLPDSSNYGSNEVDFHTSIDSDCGTENLSSQTGAEPSPPKQHDSRIGETCASKITNKTFNSRNPITGMGLNGDGVGGLKPLKPKCRRDGNPVTGEGYKSNDFNHTPSLNGANQIINKNRIPPGGFSSGLW